MRPGFFPEESFHSMIEDAVSKIVSTDDLEDFIRWFRGEVSEQSSLVGAPLDADGVRSLGTILGRAIWGATPAPHNDFRPKALPTPGRNEPCVCGSGLKYKRCCGGVPRLPTIRSIELWPFVLEALPSANRKKAVASGRVPVESLILAAERSADTGQLKHAVSLLEPLFGETIAGFDDDHDHALTMLCNMYDALGWGRKKTKLLERVRSQAPRSPLRSGAYQRLAAIAIDSGDSHEAWADFRQAQHDTPDSPMIGLLEVQLLLGEDRPDDARERARIWRRRLRRMNDEELEDAIAFFTAIIDDPYTALAEVGMRATDGAGQRLRAALRDLDDRVLPRYELVSASETEPIDDREMQIDERLRRMGVPREQRQAVTKDLFEQLENLEPGNEETGDIDDHYWLVGPAQLRTLEEDWHAVYPVEKPFSVHDVPRTAADPWEPDVEDVWMGFLERHPEAFDSIDILDDLATAVELHPMSDSFGLRDVLQQPVVDRAVQILLNAVDGSDSHQPRALPWLATENRPALRSLARAHAFAESWSDPELARAHAETLLRLNPADNHGMRAILMNTLLHTGDNVAALSLASRFPDDIFPELPYGRVLALVRMGGDREASEAAQQAVDAFPEVRRYLMRERAKQPKLSPFGITLGGKDQAWLYREDMRDVWLEEPSAMTLLKKTKPK